MTLIKRATRLFKADIHAVLDNVEEPHTLLKQAIREMETDVSQEQHHINALKKGLEHTESKINDIKNKLQKIESDIDICFKSNNDSLARSAIKRKLNAQRSQQMFKHKQNSSEIELKELALRLNDKLARLEVMRQKQEILSEENIDQINQPNTNIDVADDEVEIAFLQEKRKRAAS